MAQASGVVISFTPYQLARKSQGPAKSGANANSELRAPGMKFADHPAPLELKIDKSQFADETSGLENDTRLNNSDDMLAFGSLVEQVGLKFQSKQFSKTGDGEAALAAESLNNPEMRSSGHRMVDTFFALENVEGRARQAVESEKNDVAGAEKFTLINAGLAGEALNKPVANVAVPSVLRSMVFDSAASMSDGSVSPTLVLPLDGSAQQAVDVTLNSDDIYVGTVENEGDQKPRNDSDPELGQRQSEINDGEPTLESRQTESAIQRPIPLGTSAIPPGIAEKAASPARQIINNITMMTKQVLKAQSEGVAGALPMRLQITLHPESLGMVDVTLSSRDDRLLVVLRPEKRDTAELLERDAGVLMDALSLRAEDYGQIEVSIDFSSGEDGTEPSFSNDAWQPGGRGGPAGQRSSQDDASRFWQQEHAPEIQPEDQQHEDKPSTLRDRRERNGVYL